MRKVVIFASGPSLLQSDCHKAIRNGLPVIAVNSTWRAIPTCDYIYAGDLRWWECHIESLPSIPEKWTSCRRAHQRYDINYHDPQYHGAYNSGVWAVMFAASLGVSNIPLSGFDCSVENGSHWHGEHTMSGNPTIELALLWRMQFNHLNEYFKQNVNIINCSRKTSLTCFPVKSFDECIECYA